MKKIILSLILAISFSFAFGQKANVSKAKNKALMETPDFAGARELIQAALKDSTTKNLAETWYVAGLIGYKENAALYLKAAGRQSFDADVKGKAILESYNYYLKAVKLDSLPDKKGKIKPKYSKEIKEQIMEYYKIQLNLISYGAYLFDKKDFNGANTVFNTYLEIPKLPLMNGELKMDSMYTKIQYYNTISAMRAGNGDLTIKMCSELNNKNYEPSTVYRILYDEYQKRKDTVNMVSTLKEACEKMPNESWFLQNLINLYAFSGKTKEAINYLNKAIEREPNTAQYRYVKGSLDEIMGNIDGAMESFEKAIQLDPNSGDAYAGKARLMYNAVVKLSDAANDIKDNKKYNLEVKRVDEEFKKTVPFFEKASELKPKDMELKSTLKSLYYRLKKDPMYEKKYDALSKEMDAI